MTSISEKKRRMIDILMISFVALSISCRSCARMGSYTNGAIFWLNSLVHHDGCPQEIYAPSKS